VEEAELLCYYHMILEEDMSASYVEGLDASNLTATSRMIE